MTDHASSPNEFRVTRQTSKKHSLDDEYADTRPRAAKIKREIPSPRTNNNHDMKDEVIFVRVTENSSKVEPILSATTSNTMPVAVVVEKQQSNDNQSNSGSMNQKVADGGHNGSVAPGQITHEVSSARPTESNSDAALHKDAVEQAPGDAQDGNQNDKPMEQAHRNVQSVNSHRRKKDAALRTESGPSHGDDNPKTDAPVVGRHGTQDFEVVQSVLADKPVDSAVQRREDPATRDSLTGLRGDRLPTIDALTTHEHDAQGIERALRQETAHGPRPLNALDEEAERKAASALVALSGTAELGQIPTTTDQSYFDIELAKLSEHGEHLQVRLSNALQRQKQELEQLSSAHRQQLSELKASHEHACRKLQEANRQLMIKNDLNGQVATFKSNVSKQNENVKAVKHEYNVLDGQYRVMHRKKNEVESALRDATKRLKEAETQIETLEEQDNAHENKISCQNMKIDKLEEQNQELRGFRSEALKSRRTINQRKATITNLKDSSKAARDNAKKNEKASSKIEKELTDRIKALESAASARQVEVAQGSQKPKRAVDTAKTAIQKLKIEDTSRNEELQAKIKKLEATVTEKDQQVQSLASVEKSNVAYKSRIAQLSFLEAEEADSKFQSAIKSLADDVGEWVVDMIQQNRSATMCQSRIHLKAFDGEPVLTWAQKSLSMI